VKALGYLFTFFVLGPALTIWNAYVLTVLWVWFVVPQFGVRALSAPVAIGISYIVSNLTRRSPKREEEREKKPFDKWMIEVCVDSFVSGAVVLLFGWVVHQFMPA
jgi:hypothetical protein